MFPAGLPLYWVVHTLITVLQQMYFLKNHKKITDSNNQNNQEIESKTNIIENKEENTEKDQEKKDDQIQTPNP